MNINFKTEFPWLSPVAGLPVPTHFKEKIKACVIFPNEQQTWRPKKHTIRGLLPNGKPRYRAGMDLTFSTGKLYHYERFASAPCMAVQDVRMEVQPYRETVGFFLNVDVDGMPLTPNMIRTLALNDGFEHEMLFARWFMGDVLRTGPFVGQIVHWTDLRY